MRSRILFLMVLLGMQAGAWLLLPSPKTLTLTLS